MKEWFIAVLLIIWAIFLTIPMAIVVICEFIILVMNYIIDYADKKIK